MKISIIIPVYNTEKYLRRCLDSVLNQTYQDFEVICVNDGSPDFSDIILQEYALKDDRVNIVTQKNSGVSVARNEGLKKATGEYIQFLDSDDAIHPQALNIAVELAKSNNVDIVSYNYEKSDGIEYNPKYIDEKNIKFTITNNPIFLGCKGKNRFSLNIWTKLYKRTILNGIEFIPNNSFEDFPHVYAVLSKKPKTLSINTSLVLYTINQDSISNQKSTVKHIKDYYESINYIYNIYTYKNLGKELNFIKKDLIPSLLKQQLNKCKKSSKDIQHEMYECFAMELIDLNNKCLISWKYNLKRYCIYKYLMNKYKLV